MTRKQRCLGESQVSYFLIAGLVILVCVLAASGLGQECIAVILGTDKAAQYMKARSDPEGDEDRDGEPNETDQDPLDENVQ